MGVVPSAGSLVYTGYVQIFGSKIQDFFPDYFQNNGLFSQTQGYQIIIWSKETLKNAGTRLFFQDAMQTYDNQDAMQT